MIRLASREDSVSFIPGTHCLSTPDPAPGLQVGLLQWHSCVVSIPANLVSGILPVEIVHDVDQDHTWKQTQVDLAPETLLQSREFLIGKVLKSFRFRRYDLPLALGVTRLILVHAGVGFLFDIHVVVYAAVD